MGNIETIIENLSVFEFLCICGIIGGTLAFVCALIFRWKTVVRLFEETNQKRLDRRAAMYRGIHKTLTPIKKLTKKQKRAGAQKYDINRAYADAGLTMVERGISAAYRGWHRLPAIARLVLCLPMCAVLVGVVFFCTIWPSFMGALSFGESKVLLQDLNMIPIFTMHLSIYLLMSRWRFILSGLLAFGILAYAVFMFTQLPAGTDFWDVTCRGFYHCIAAFCVYWAWIKSTTNRPAAMFQLTGGLVLSSGILNVILSLLMFFWVPINLEGIDTNKLLGSPIYHSFEPFLKQIMAPLHLHLGDFTPENLVLAFLILIWGGTLFCVGTFMCYAKYNAIAAVPDGVEKVGLYR